MHQKILRALLHPDRLLTCSEIRVKPCPIVSKPGVYAWYFRQVPPRVPTQGCHVFATYTLFVYWHFSVPATKRRIPARAIGPEANPISRSRECGRVDAASIPGLLVGSELGNELRRVGSGERMTFVMGEQRLSAWMAEHALVDLEGR